MGYGVHQFREISWPERSFQMNFDSGLFDKWHGSLKSMLYCRKVVVGTDGRGIHEGNHDTIHANSTTVTQDTCEFLQAFVKYFSLASQQRSIHKIVGTHRTNANPGRFYEAL